MQELQARGQVVRFVIYRSQDQQAALDALVAQNSLEAHWVDSQEEALAYYLKEKPSWVIFGNSFDAAAKLKGIDRKSVV